MLLTIKRYTRIQSARLLTSLLVCLIAGIAQPVYASPSDRSDSTTVKRPRIGLALSGGGARGAAHVGILKILEQNYIPIDYIAGTSMGSVIGALYASGMTPVEITKALAEIDWEGVFDDDGPRTDKTTRDKADDRLYLVDQQLGVKDGRARLPTALIQGQRFEQAIRKLTLQASNIHDFDKLPIPFRAIATDITTGEEVILGKGDLGTAIRASMAVPGAFAAVEIDGRLLVDGGLANNLPISVVRDMGADIIIAIDISTSLRKRDELNDALAIISQLTGLLTRRNTEKQIAGLTGQDILIIPELGNLTAADFNRYDDAIAAGSIAATKQLAQLKSLALSSTDYAQHMSTHNTDYFQPPVIDFVQIKNNSIVYDEVLRARLDIKPGDSLDTDILDKGINDIYAMGIYSHVSYSLFEEDGKTGLEITAREKEWGTSGIQFGVDMSSDLDGSSSFDFSAAYTMKPTNGLNGEWRTLVVLGENPTLLTEWYQPLDNKEEYFINPILLASRNTFNNFYDNKIISKHRAKSLQAQLWLGRNFADQMVRVRVGYNRASGSVNLLTGDPRIPQFKSRDFDSAELSAEFRYDSLDNVSFPTSGSALELTYSASRESLGADSDFEQATLVGLGTYPLGKGTLLLAGVFNTTVDDGGSVQDSFEAGGFLNLSGLQRDQISGPHSGLLLASYMYKLSNSQFFSTYVGGSLELGNVWRDTSEISFSNTLTAGSLFVGADTPIGPVYIAAGAAEGGEKSLYLFIGSPWF